jgi:hypothetical protein
MTAARGSTALFAALAVLVGLVLAVPPAHAVEEMRQFNKDDTKTGRTKACPKGERYSERKRDCVKTSCGTGQVWSSGVDACLDGKLRFID